MSEATPANTPAEPKPSTKCGDGLVWNAELEECVPVADKNVVGAGAAASAEKGMFAAVKAVLNDALTEMRKNVMLEAQTMMKSELKAIQQEFAVGLRKELGLSEDPSVTKSELEGAVRKAVLDLKFTGKKTPASPSLQKASDATERPGDIFNVKGGN